MQLTFKFPEEPELGIIGQDFKDQGMTEEEALWREQRWHELLEECAEYEEGEFS